MKTSTKVIIKFQVFTSAILFIVLFLVNAIFFKAGITQYDEKIVKIEKNMMHMNFHWWMMKNWQIVKNNCFTMYQEKYCLTNENKNIFGFYHIDDKFFYLKNKIVFDITDFFVFQRLFVQISIFIFLFYLVISYFLWRLFLKSIYKKIFKAVKDLQEKNYIDLKYMNLSKDDELKILFDTINNQIDSISSFNKYLSHELKTPLMNISSTLDILSLKYNDEKINHLKNEIFNIKSIIETLNKLILIENKNLKLETEKVDICEFIKDFSLKIGLKLDIDCKINQINTNKELFSILVKNILENMKKYSKWENKVFVYKDKIIFQNKTDTIKNPEKLTEKFYKEWIWLGLGLYLVKKVSELLNYELKIFYEDGVFQIKIIF